MRYKSTLLIFIFLFISGLVIGQSQEGETSGKVSYVTTQNVYVKFPSTETLTPGDTLFIPENGILTPVLIIKETSSISCVCIPLNDKKLSVGDQVSFRMRFKQKEETSPAALPSAVAVVNPKDSVSSLQPVSAKRKQILTGNLSVASYLNFSNVSANNERMKYTFSMAIQNIGNSKLSAETYISFAHKLGDWSAIQQDVFNGLRIYSLSLNYEFNRHHNLWLGRKINPRISNVGAIDGLQYELKAGAFSLGLFGGTRPDYKNYSFNASLVQYGGYLGHDYAGKNGQMQTTVAFIQQLNQGNTDRRFAYLQHTNALIKNLFFFGSVEVDLYKKTLNPVDTATHDSTYTKSSSPVLSNLYLSLRYRPIRQLSVSISYSNRQNVIYYETYKSLVDRLLEAATVQGFTLQVNYSPVKLISLGANAGYRNSKQDPRPAKNLYAYLTFNNIPGVNIAATLSATLLETSYMSGKIFSLGLSREIIPGKLSGGVAYRYVSYKFYSGESKLTQNMGEANLSWRILKKLSCGLYYEGTFDRTSTFNRVYIFVTQRF